MVGVGGTSTGLETVGNRIWVETGSVVRDAYGGGFQEGCDKRKEVGMWV